MISRNCTVLAQGCHTGALDYQHVVVGDPANGQYGRVMKALEIAQFLSPEVLMIGTGASELDGLKEAQVMQGMGLSYMNEHNNDFQLRHFEWLTDAVLDIESQNTTQELENALTYCVENGIRDLYHISSPFHAERCMDEARKLLQNPRFTGKVFTHFVKSSTNPRGCTAEGTMVVELPCYLELPGNVSHGHETRVEESLYLANQIKRIFPIFRTESLPEFLGQLHDLVERTLNGADFSVATPYKRQYEAEGQVVVEQPHRGDDPQLKLPQAFHLASQVKEILRIYPTGRLPKFLGDLNELIQKFTPAA